jgi:hypothetical protein
MSWIIFKSVILLPKMVIEQHFEIYSVFWEFNYPETNQYRIVQISRLDLQFISVYDGGHYNMQLRFISSTLYFCKYCWLLSTFLTHCSSRCMSSSICMHVCVCGLPCDIINYSRIFKLLVYRPRFIDWKSMFWGMKRLLMIFIQRISLRKNSFR